MSKYRNWWRPNVERAIREYPALRRRLNDLQSPSATQGYSLTPGRRVARRKTENNALRTLSPQEQRWIDAVEKALNAIKNRKHGDETLALVQMVYFAQSCTIQGAAMKLFISESTAKRRAAVFVDLVAMYAEYYGYEERRDKS